MHKFGKDFDVGPGFPAEVAIRRGHPGGAGAPGPSRRRIRRSGVELLPVPESRSRHARFAVRSVKVLGAVAFVAAVAFATLVFLRGYVHARRQAVPTIVTPATDFEAASHPPVLQVLERLKRVALTRLGCSPPDMPRAVAFTFDDGPFRLYTPALLDMLRRQRVKATFFVEGKDVQMHPELLRCIAADGHELGNHSFTHASFVTLDTAGITRELEQTTTLLSTLVGVRPAIMRPPGGRLDAERMRVVQKLGYTVVFGDVNPGDYRENDPLRIYTFTMMHNMNRAVVLLHSGRMVTVRALPTIIDAYRRKGYQFVTISELARLQGIDIPPLPTPAVGRAP